MGKIICREYRPEDARSFLRTHDAIFPPVTAEYLAAWSRGPVTASVAELDGEVVGAVPFVFRDLRIHGDAVARVAWEHSVGVREDVRATGIGSRLMEEAKAFLPGRCVAMMVYRDDERSPAYRWYHRNGHQDLLYARLWKAPTLPEGPQIPRPREAGADVLPWEALLRDERSYREVFESAYAAYGGYPVRKDGFYAPAVDTMQYHEIPVQLRLLVQRKTGGELAGYAILGSEANGGPMHLLELATRDGNQAFALSLLGAFTDLSRWEGVRANAMTSDASPYVHALKAAGFQPEGRADNPMMIMAYLLDPEALAGITWRESFQAAGLDVIAWTPKREVHIHRARRGHRSPARRVVLEMKERTLARLLFSRLDLVSAVRQETVTVVGAGPAEIEAIAQALPFAPWVYHYLDQI